MPNQTHNDVLEQLNWRYATKQFDPDRKISDSDWHSLEESLRLSPSSYGFQPWQFIVVKSPEVRAKLRPNAWNQPQITDASHLVVLCAKSEMSASDADRWIERNAEVRQVDRAALAGFHQMLVGFVQTLSQGTDTPHWTAKQAYIALGMFMAMAATIGIDTCPIEGFSPAAFDEVLQLNGTGYRSVVVVAAGYRASGDKQATLPKTRYEKGDVIRYV